jgi:hypothetical protein
MCVMRQNNFASLTKTERQSFRIHYELNYMDSKGKVTPLQAQCGPEGGQRYSSTLP